MKSQNENGRAAENGKNDPKNEEDKRAKRIEKVIRIWRVRMCRCWGRFSVWVKRHNEPLTLIIQVGLCLVAVGSMWIVYIMSTQQNKLTYDAFRYQVIKDSVNELSQHKKDLLFAENQKTRDSLNVESFILENRAYLSFKEISPLR